MIRPVCGLLIQSIAPNPEVVNALLDNSEKRNPAISYNFKLEHWKRKKGIFAGFANAQLHIT